MQWTIRTSSKRAKSPRWMRLAHTSTGKSSTSRTRGRYSSCNRSYPARRNRSNQEFAPRVHRLLCALAEIHRRGYRTASLHGWTLRDEIMPTLQMLQPIGCDSRPAVALDPRPQSHVGDRIVTGDVFGGGELIVEHTEQAK